MKVIFVVLAVAAIAQASIIPDALKAEFKAFKLKHEKIYKDASEELKRLQIFIENKKIIDSHNKLYEAGEKTYTMGINQFSDMTPAEFKEKILSKINPEELTKGVDAIYTPNNRIAAPASIDWRNYGAVTPVKNQGGCGSCWAFSALGSLEARWFFATNQLRSLSEQNLVDCSPYDGGCNGGWPSNSLFYIRDNGGVNSQATYPYEARDGPCRFNGNDRAATVSAVFGVAANEGSLAQAVSDFGPISVAISAAYYQNYNGGVLNEPNCNAGVDHGVLVVGYGTDAHGGDYWLVKNSWGTGWGEGGYIRMARNRNNQCSIATYGVFPNV